jgi:hypothetical protein
MKILKDSELTLGLYNVWEQLVDQIEVQIIDKVLYQLKNKVMNPVRLQVRDQVWDKIEHFQSE